MQERPPAIHPTLSDNVVRAPLRVSRLRVALVASMLVASRLAAQDTAFVRVLRASSSEMQMRGGHLVGAGADSLAAQARANQFLLVGEDHGIREVPEFVGALFELAKPAGYRHLGVEVGPFTARFLEDMMRTPGSQRDLDDFLARHTPYSIPFFFWREEAQMLERVVRTLAGEKNVVWGLDQEFMASPTYLFEQLADLAP